jgi:ADP-ribosyl-[dinitrogen reductase] hydrolase
MASMQLSSAQTDRACGVLLGAACGDALGAAYEFGSAPLPPAGTAPEMIGGGLGGFAPGEWTDDTAQAYAIAEVAATGADLRSDEALTAIARRFADWYAERPPDVGIQTRAVLSAAGRHPTAEEMSRAAAAVHERAGRSAGNGSLMRTAALALAHLDDPEALVEAAMRVSALTHFDPQAGEACALWCLMIRQAVLTGSLDDVRQNLELLPEASRDFWAERLEEAESSEPGTFRPNGWVVSALQAAWSAILQTPVPDEALADGSFACLHLQHALETAIRIGDDTDTVAAIAGALLGARWGVSAIPAAWREKVHGWPGARAADLVNLALLTIRRGRPDRQGWPVVDRLDYDDYDGFDSYALHPHDPGVHLSGAGLLETPPEEVDAVVSLCRLGAAQVPESLRGRQLDFRLLDTVPEDNPNLAFVLDDAARTVARLRDEGRTVLLHCVAAQSRTPSVAVRYSMLRGVPFAEALADVRRALPGCSPNPHLVAAVEEFVVGTEALVGRDIRTAARSSKAARRN